jgi:hypothetical protein
VRPAEFHYEENLGKPWARALRRSLEVALGFDPAPSRELVEAFASAYYDGDPFAESLVEGARGASREALARALDQDVESEPAWLDWAEVEHGARVFRRYGPSVFRFAGSITLQGYSESSVAKPLALTGAYAGDSTRKRFLETVAFWIAVSEPGGLREGAKGRASALRVRLMHVFVRKRLLAHPEWNLEAWGVPISQADAALTLMGGSFIPGLAMKAMGYRPSNADIEAMMHFWRWAGHLMGVRPSFYPTSMRQAWQLMFASIVKGSGLAGDDGRHLCQSYVRAFAPDPRAPRPERLRAALSDGVHRGYARFFVPPWTYRKNELPPAGLWALYPALGFPFVFGAETLRRMVPPLEAVADRVASRRRLRFYRRHAGDREAEYRPAETFTR